MTPRMIHEIIGLVIFAGGDEHCHRGRHNRDGNCGLANVEGWQVTIENAEVVAITVCHWKRRAVTAEAEVERLRKLLSLISSTLAPSMVKVSEILLGVVTPDVVGVDSHECSGSSGRISE